MTSAYIHHITTCFIQNQQLTARASRNLHLRHPNGPRTPLLAANRLLPEPQTTPSLRPPAFLTHYRRVAVNHSDFPTKHGTASEHVEGYRINPTARSHWKKVDDFEGESYSRQYANIELVKGVRIVPAHVYVWQGVWMCFFLIKNEGLSILGTRGCRIGWTCLRGWRWLGKVSGSFLF